MKNKLTQFNKLYKILFLSVCLMLPSQQIFAHAGTIIFANGTVKVKSKKGDIRKIKRGSKVRPGETVITGKDSRVQIRTGDGSFISLPPKSELVIAAHKHTGPIEKQHSSLDLVKGGMRAVTGLIGKNKPDHFRITARGSTIGVRGTEFVVQICDDDECNQAAKGKEKDPADNGVYVGIVSGAITVQKNKKEVELDASLNVVMGVSMGIKKDSIQYVFLGEGKKKEPEKLKQAPIVLVKAMAPPPLIIKPKGAKNKDKAPPLHNMSPFEGIESGKLQLHLAATAPIAKPISALEDFEELDYHSKPGVMGPHNEIRIPYTGHSINDGQRYDLTEGFPRLDYWGP